MNTNMIYKACGWALAVALLTACSDEPGLSDGQPAGPHVNLNVSSGLQPASRTILQGEQNVQHVTRVSLYAYKHTEANNALTATYIGGMSFGEVDWQQDIETAMKDGTSTQQQLVALPESWKIDEDQSATYTLLAIGSDDSKIKDDGTVGSEFLAPTPPPPMAWTIKTIDLAKRLEKVTPPYKMTKPWTTSTAQSFSPAP